MPVKRRTAKMRRFDVSEVVEAFLTDQPLPEDDGVGGWERYVHTYHRRKGDLAVPTIEDYWAQLGETITAEWAREHPGTRPSCWWEFSSPRWDLQPALGVPRLKVGGGGVPEHVAHPEWRMDPHDFAYGLPSRWRPHPPPDNPPLFEAQATYLDRHGLLLPGERERLTPHDFEPERVCVPVDPYSC